MSTDTMWIEEGLEKHLKRRLNRDAYYSTSEAAQQLGSIKTSTVKQYLRSGRLNGRKAKIKGFREEWQVLGGSIIDLRQKLGLNKKEKL
jgi:hypothetical protein